MAVNKGPQTGLMASEPVMVAAFVHWALINVGLFFVGRTTLLTGDQWSTVASALTPLVSGAVLAVLGWVLRRYVTPAWKKVAGTPEPTVQTTVTTITKSGPQE